MSDLSDLAAQCIRCGFCLESCPTFMVTGDESQSPRGRIYLARNAEEGKIAWNQAEPALATCLGCRACETACPSGVEYGALLELAREKIGAASPKRAEQALLKVLTNPAMARASFAASSLIPGGRMPDFMSKLLFGQTAEADSPRPQERALWPELNESRLPEVKGEVYLLEGCVMRVLFPRVHQATRRLLRRIGYVPAEVDGGCCGALHAHSGELNEAAKRAEKLGKAFSDDLPIIVNSAGCGSTLKSYGTHFGDERIAKQTWDISEFLLEHGLLDLLPQAKGISATATYHDACHLAHGQGVRSQPRELLRAIPGLKWVALPESETCCGSAGIYNITQPHLARQLLERKWANVSSTTAEILVSGNPGCHAWLEQASREKGQKVKVLHTVEILEAAFSGIEGIIWD